MPKKKPAPQAKTAVIYARYSSDRQNDASIEQQVEICREYADRNNMTIVAVYADRAMSGRSDRRPEFQKMMRAADGEHFNVVIAYKSNRISRNMLHALTYEQRLADAGIELIYAKEEFGNNAAGRFALRTMMNLNQFYSETSPRMSRADCTPMPRSARRTASRCSGTPLPKTERMRSTKAKPRSYARSSTALQPVRRRLRSSTI